MRFLICGLGSIGKRHLRILNGLGNHGFVALRSRISADNFPGIEKVIFSAEEIRDVKIDAALITNPTSLHITTASQIAGFGIPLFIEKPLGNNLEGIESLREIVDKKKIPVLMGYNMLFHPGIKLMKTLIGESRIGRVICAKAQFGTYMPGWHKDEDYRKSYAALKELGGGVTLTSIHEQNYLTDMFGEIVDVKAMETGGDVIGIESEEGVEILFKHRSGVISNVHLNFFQKPYYRNCQIIGTGGTILWDFRNTFVKVLTDEGEEVIDLDGDYIQLLNESYENQMKHFIEVASGREKPRVSLEQGVNDLKVSLQVLKEIGRN